MSTYSLGTNYKAQIKLKDVVISFLGTKNKNKKNLGDLGVLSEAGERKKDNLEKEMNAKYQVSTKRPAILNLIPHYYLHPATRVSRVLSCY